MLSSENDSDFSTNLKRNGRLLQINAGVHKLFVKLGGLPQECVEQVKESLLQKTYLGTRERYSSHWAAITKLKGLQNKPARQSAFISRFWNETEIFVSQSKISTKHKNRSFLWLVSGRCSLRRAAKAEMSTSGKVMPAIPHYKRSAGWLLVIWNTMWSALLNSWVGNAKKLPFRLV